MIQDVIMLILSLAFILISCIFFTNSVEWLGKKLNLNQGVVGSILAAVGTALPETIIPIIAIIFYSGKEASQIATGAILGAPFMLSTLGFLMTGVAVILYSSANKRSIKMNADPNVFRRDLAYFILIYTLAIFTSVFNQFNEVRLASVVLLLTLYLLYVRATFNSEGKIEQNVEELLFSRIFSLPPTLSWIIIQLFISLSGIIFSSHLFVGYVKDLSHLMGVSPLILSLVITPIATELPEKFNSIVWVGQKKRYSCAWKHNRRNGVSVFYTSYHRDFAYPMEYNRNSFFKCNSGVDFCYFKFNMDKHEKISKSFYTHVRRNTVRNIFTYCNSLIRSLTSVVHIVSKIDKQI